MKSQKGITLTSLAIYIMVVLVVLGILAIITVNLQDNIKQADEGGTINSEFDKFNIYFLKDIKTEGNKINEISANEISFTSGNKYTFRDDDNCVYLNDNIKIAKNIETCAFSNSTIEDKVIIEVVIKVKNGEKRTIEYTLIDSYELSL